MKCKPSKTLIWLLGVSFLTTGCTPTRPVYLNESGDLNYYLEQATKIEYPDIETPTLDEVTQAYEPMTVMDPDFESYEDMTLEDAVSYTLQNSKVLRGYGTPGLQGTRVSPGVDNLANGPTAAGTIYNVAVRETEPGFIGTAGQIASPSGLTTNTALDSNQGVEAALADFDAQFTSGITWSTTDRPRNISALSSNDPNFLFARGDQVQWQAEVAKKSANGTQIFFRNVNTYTDTNNPLNDVNINQGANSFYQANFEAEIRQPLLRGRGAFINRMPVVISRIGTDQELANLEAQLQNSVTNVEIRYWDLYCAYRNLDAAKTGRNAALETWRIVKDQFDEGADVNVQQVAQASEQYHFFDAQVVDAYNNLLNAEGALRFLLGWSSTDCRMIRPIDEPIMAPVEFDWCTSLCEALTYRPELRQERWEIKKRELALAYSKNGLLPELNATALYRFLGLGNRFGTSGDAAFPIGENQAIEPGQSGALNSLYDGNFQELQLGLNFGIPVGFRRELANVRNAQLKLAREIARIEDMELDVTRELTEAMRALAANQMIMRSSFNRWKETTIEEEHFQRLKDEGVETLDVALDAQRRRSQAEIAFYTALCEYNKTIVLIHRRKGTTLPYCGVEFSEGPWAGKAYVDAQEHARRRSASRELNYGWTRPQVISRGENWPTGSNNGATHTTDGSYSDSMIYDDATIVPSEGEIYNGPYYEGEVIQEQPIYDGAPAPTLAPPQEFNTVPQGSGSRISPAPQGSTSRVHRDSSIRQVSYEKPARATQKMSSRSKGKSKAKAKTAPNKRSRSTEPATIRQPKRDYSERPVQRLRATTPKPKVIEIRDQGNNGNQASRPPSSPLRNSRVQNSTRSQVAPVSHTVEASSTYSGSRALEQLGVGHSAHASVRAGQQSNRTVARIKTTDSSVVNDLR
jgi:outer membrane protein TolC